MIYTYFITVIISKLFLYCLSAIYNYSKDDCHFLNYPMYCGPMILLFIMNTARIFISYDYYHCYYYHHDYHYRYHYYIIQQN